MIFGYTERGEMRIYQNLKEALSEWERYPIDILSEVVIFYTEDGKYLKPSAVYAKRKWYQLRPSIDHITFQEIPPTETHMDELGYLVHFETLSVRDNQFINSVDKLKEKFIYEE